MVDDMAMRLLVEQRKRLVASVLNAAEGSGWWHKLSREQQVAFRDKVLSSVGVYYDFCRDIIKVGQEDAVVNGHALELIESLHEGQRRLERQFGGA